MRKSICLVLPSFRAGGQERVMAQLARYFAERSEYEVHMISLIKGEKFYQLPQQVFFHEPEFSHRQFSRMVFTWKTLLFLRAKLKSISPKAVLSFGGRYNTFVILAAWNLGIRVFVSDRSRPSISYGRVLDRLNPLMYRLAAGIIAQTEVAKRLALQNTRHHNIKVINNPIRQISAENEKREDIILNVGRFIPSKHQQQLIKYFAAIRPVGWRLIFLGEGAGLEEAKRVAQECGVENKVVFAGVIENIDDYYLKSKIFAFTSTSEGFPNALGEAMAGGCACMSFDCEAGPSELIEDGVNGFLIKEMDHQTYQEKLSILIQNKDLRRTFRQRGREKMKQFKAEYIAQQYLEFILDADDDS